MAVLQVAKLEKELAAARAGKRDSSGYNRQPRTGASGASGNKPFNQMTGEEKRRITCPDYNSGRGCARVEMNGNCGSGASRLRHGCSRVEGNHICWKSHAEADHV